MGCAATEAEEEQAAELRQSLIIPLNDDNGSVGSEVGGSVSAAEEQQT